MDYKPDGTILDFPEKINRPLFSYNFDFFEMAAWLNNIRNILYEKIELIEEGRAVLEKIALISGNLCCLHGYYHCALSNNQFNYSQLTTIEQYKEFKKLEYDYLSAKLQAINQICNLWMEIFDVNTTIKIGLKTTIKQIIPNYDLLKTYNKKHNHQPAKTAKLIFDNEVLGAAIEIAKSKKQSSRYLGIRAKAEIISEKFNIGGEYGYFGEKLKSESLADIERHIRRTADELIKQNTLYLPLDLKQARIQAIAALKKQQELPK